MKEGKKEADATAALSLKYSLCMVKPAAHQYGARVCFNVFERVVNSRHVFFRQFPPTEANTQYQRPWIERVLKSNEPPNSDVNHCTTVEPGLEKACFFSISPYTLDSFYFDEDDVPDGALMRN